MVITKGFVVKKKVMIEKMTIIMVITIKNEWTMIMKQKREIEWVMELIIKLTNSNFII